jgi:hypothetical protein
VLLLLLQLNFIDNYRRENLGKSLLPARRRATLKSTCPCIATKFFPEFLSPGQSNGAILHMIPTYYLADNIDKT